MKKVLIMGGSYFIGKKIADILSNSKYDVTVLNRGTKKLENKKITQIICDRNNAIKMHKTLNSLEFDIIIDVCGTTKSQVEILCNSINVQKLSHFVFISSSAVYNVDELTIPFNETDKLGENVWGKYGTDKIEAEKYLTDFFENTNAKLIMLRPPYVYGENNYAQRESFIFEHLCNDKPIIIPKSNPQLQFIYTSDLANIIIKLLKNKSNDKISIFNVGNAKPVTAKQWVNTCADVVGKTPNIIEYDYKKDNRFIRDFFPFYDYDNVLDTSKIKAIYPNEIVFKDGLKIAYQWYLNEKNNISFKEVVSKNEILILKEGFK